MEKAKETEMLKMFEKSVSKKGFTLVELLTVMAIIALLIGLLVPALGHVKTTAKIVQQKAQLDAIVKALEAFSGMYGDYPPSNETSLDKNYSTATTNNTITCGAQKMAEAVLGVDLRGFDPRATTTGSYTFDRYAIEGDKFAYAVNGVNGATAGPAPTIADDVTDSLNRRKGPYVKIDESVGSFEVKDLFANPGTKIYAGGSPGHDSTGNVKKLFGNVITDVFKVKNVTYTSIDFTAATPTAVPTTAKAGTPILYYKANTASKTLDPTNDTTIDNSIYNWHDNMDLVMLGRMNDQTKPHWWQDTTNPAHVGSGTPADATAFYSYIQNPKIGTTRWPYNQDSYILISAGPDGIYGTADDICNFSGSDMK
jgi:prepilin-type N-terminal cleavage/methylation domain-containing protein